LTKKIKGKADARKKPLTRALIIAALVVLAAILILDYFNTQGGAPNAFELISTVRTREQDDLSVHFLDVGQGDGIMIEFPDGKNMMIDGGDRDKKIAEKLISYINGHNIRVFDYIMLTHPHADHAGGLNDVINMQNVAVKTVYMPMVKSSSDSDPLKYDASASYISTAVYRDFVDAVVAKQSAVEYSVGGIGGIVIEGEGYKLTLYTPLSLDAYLNLGTSDTKLHAISPIMILEYAGKRIMFTGDANSVTEKQFIDFVRVGNLYGEVDADVLKVGHHGSSTSTTRDFLDLIKPEYAVICCGAGNTYGHPHQDTLDRLASVSGFTGLGRTDTNGDIVLTITKNSAIIWSTQRYGGVSAGSATVIISFFKALTGAAYAHIAFIRS
jgi:beta-lactamase superfamily II metal-dependent hydrolase